MLSLSACVIIVSLCYHCQPVLSLSACVITVSLCYHCQPVLSLSACVIIVSFKSQYVWKWVSHFVPPPHHRWTLFEACVIIVSLCYHCQPVLSLSACVIIVSLCYHCQPVLSLSACVIIVSLCYHCQPVLSLSALSLSMFGSGFLILFLLLIIDGLCLRPVLSLSACVITVSLCYHCQPVLSLSACVITVSLCYHCQPVLSLSACVITVSLCYHCQPVLSLSACVIIVSFKSQYVWKWVSHFVPPPHHRWTLFEACVIIVSLCYHCQPVLSLSACVIIVSLCYHCQL